MAPDRHDTKADLHCTKQSAALGHRAAGSATQAERFILIELPPPWPDDIENHLLLGAEAEAPGGDERPTRILAIRGPETGRKHTDTLIIVHTARYEAAPAGGPSGFIGYEAVERSVPLHEIATTVAAAREGDLAGFDTNRDAGPDVLICTHGSRDRCCGQWGTLLFVELTARLDGAVRLWRTSHTGGHRFAPTGITFPDGFAWAWLNADLVETIVNRSVDPERLVDHMRGCSAFGPIEQVADAAALATEGWDWLNDVRRVSVQTDDRGEFHTTASCGGLVHQAVVTQLESVPVPPCGQPLDLATKSSRQYRIEPAAQQAAPAS